MSNRQNIHVGKRLPRSSKKEENAAREVLLAFNYYYTFATKLDL